MTNQFLTEILAQKKKEVAAMPEETLLPKRQAVSFYDSVKANPKMSLIAEVKKASPSMGAISLDCDILEQARTYEVNGASMISVLTDKGYFKGSFEDIKQVSSQVALPTLNKDFIISEKQIIKARNSGATVILLIVAALTEERLKELYGYAYSLDMEVLVETHDSEELAVAHRIGAKLIGVNNRNLKTFEVSLETSLNLVQYFEEEPVYISESGIVTAEDVARLSPYFDGILVGTTLMQAKNLTEKIKELIDG